MLLKITHETNLNYSELISESVMELRMAPLQSTDQHRLSFNLAIGPPTSVTGYFDWLGNTVHAFSISGFHSQIRIVATSVVETDRPNTQPEKFADRWPIAADAYDYSVYDYLQFGGPIVDSQRLRDLVAVLKPSDEMALGELALRMLHLIDEQFTYEKGITNAASPITEILQHNRGVCQDFTHLMIGLARALKIPARYVSGFIHPDAERLRGYTQTHAWCELLFPSAGWIGFDPTNRCIVGPNFVTIATGRNYSDVAPNRGIYRGKAEESISVGVNSQELKSVPPELAAERMQSLQIPVYADGSALHREFVNQQMESQQQ